MRNAMHWNIKKWLLHLQLCENPNFDALKGGCTIYIEQTTFLVRSWLDFTLKRTLRQKKNYENSNISPCQNIILKNPLKETQILQAIINL